MNKLPEIIRKITELKKMHAIPSFKHLLSVACLTGKNLPIYACRVHKFKDRFSSNQHFCTSELNLFCLIFTLFFRDFYLHFDASGELIALNCQSKTVLLHVVNLNHAPLLLHPTTGLHIMC